MPRAIKYKTADNLLDHCQVHNDCYIWPESSCPIPMIGPASPMALRFGTTSVVRILFVICKYIPAGKRLVRKCNSSFCVNPFHFTESVRYMSKRAKLANPSGLFPQQEDARDRLAPPDRELEAMRPKNPAHIKRLMDSALVAGFNCDGLNTSYYAPPKFRAHTFAGEAPVLVVKSYTTEPVAPVQPMTDDDWDELERPFRRSEPLPEVQDETDEEVDHTDLTNDIFEMIRRRNEWQAKKPK